MDAKEALRWSRPFLAGVPFLYQIRWQAFQSVMRVVREQGYERKIRRVLVLGTMRDFSPDALSTVLHIARNKMGLAR